MTFSFESLDYILQLRIKSNGRYESIFKDPSTKWSSFAGSLPQRDTDIMSVKFQFDLVQKIYPKRSILALLEIKDCFQKTNANGAFEIIDCS